MRGHTTRKQHFKRMGHC